MPSVIIYSKADCPYCDWAKQLLNSKQIAYSEIRIDLDSTKRTEMEQLSGRRTVPQIFINNKSIGGYDDLSALIKSGELDNLIKGNAS